MKSETLLSFAFLALAVVGCEAGGENSNPGGDCANSNPFEGDAVQSHAEGATLELTVTPDAYTGWATYDIMYFTVDCTWSDGVEDPGCNDAGEPVWTTDYGWFEDMRFCEEARTEMEVVPEAQRIEM